MLLTDTDSFLYKIEIENVHADFYKKKELFDIGNYSKDSNHFDNSNKLNKGKTKDKTRSAPTAVSIGLKAKIPLNKRQL